MMMIKIVFLLLTSGAYAAYLQVNKQIEVEVCIKVEVDMHVLSPLAGFRYYSEGTTIESVVIEKMNGTNQTDAYQITAKITSDKGYIVHEHEFKQFVLFGQRHYTRIFGMVRGPCNQTPSDDFVNSSTDEHMFVLSAFLFIIGMAAALFIIVEIIHEK